MVHVKFHTFSYNILHKQIMKKIKLFIAASIDGYIATPDGDIDWLRGFPNPEHSDYGFKQFLSGIDTVLMGGRAYRTLQYMDIVWPYKGKAAYIIARNPVRAAPGSDIHSITEDVTGKVARLKEGAGKDIGLAGGGELTAMLLREGLIDEMAILTIPVLLGDGIPLFPRFYAPGNWNVKDNKVYANGLTQTVYHKVASR